MPTAISDLAVHQRGATVVLNFSLPKESVAKQPLPETPAIEIYRGTRGPGVKGKVATRLIYRIPAAMVSSYTHDGKVEFRDTLETKQGANEDLDYTVRTRVLKKAASDESNVAEIHVFPAPATPAGLKATVTETSIDLTWTAPTATIFGSGLPGAVTYQVYRGELEPGAAPSSGTTPEKYHVPPAQIGTSQTTSFQDQHFTFGTPYVYTVRAVIEQSGQAVESADSPSVDVTPADVFPPSAPTGLVAVTIPATPQEAAHVELSWNINPEADLAGYWVYRSEAPDTMGQRLNSQVLLSPAFRDMTAVPGKRYFYRVSAVDRSGNESPQSAPILGQIP